MIAHPKSILRLVILAALASACARAPIPAPVPAPAPPPPLEISAERWSTESWGRLVDAVEWLEPTVLVLAPVAGRAEAVVNEEAVTTRHILGDSALETIHRNIANVNQVLRAAQIASALGLAANPWSDQGFRNLWDRLENFGTTAGLGFATYSALRSNDDSSDQIRSVGFGLLIAGASKGVATLIGNQSGERFEKKVRFVEFTRRAYDHLQTVYLLTQADVESNRSFRSEIESFLQKYRAAGSVTERREQLILAGAYLTRYDLVLTQIPAAVQRYRAAIDRFCPGAVQAARAGAAGAHVCEVREAGQVYRVEGESRDKLMAAAVQLVEMQDEMEDANSIRLLSSRFREAFMVGL
jgi:hypothetical protein